MNIKDLRKRQREDLLELFREQYDTACITERVDSYLSDIISGGTEGALRLRGVDYGSQNRSDWGLAKHYRPLLFLAHASRLCEEEERASHLIRVCRGLLLDWVDTGYKCPNWWYNVIDMPLVMGEILLLIGDALTRDLFDRCMQVIVPGSIVDDPSIELNHSGGANFLWIASATLNQCILREDEGLLASTVKRVEEVALIYDKAGFQTDDSFFQHGNRLYSCGYGRSFVVHIANIVYALRDTPYQLPGEKLMLASRHILFGIRYMSHRGFADYAASGREYVRPNALSLKGLTPSLKRLAAVPEMPRAKEIGELADDILAGRALDLGIKYFPIAKLLVNHLNGIYIGFRGGDDKTVDAEIINKENPLGYNLSYGTHTTVMQTGEEYSNVAPLWNYSQIPGTTAYNESDEELLAREDFSYRTLPLTHFGGVCEQGVGICYLKTEHEGTRATVSAFATPYGTAILGCDLGNDHGKALVTTVEQCKRVGEVRADGECVIHGSVAYRTLDKSTTLSHTVEHRCGSFRRQRLTGADIQTEDDILTVLVERDASYNKYAYLITEQSLSDADFEVLRNDGELQAIRTPDGRILAVFYKSADLIVDGNLYHGEENSANIF